MAEDIKVNNLIINQLSNEKFATIEKDPTQLYLTPDTSIDASEKGVAGGVATLDSNVKVPTDQIPALPYLPTSGGKASGNINLEKNDSFIGFDVNDSTTTAITFGSTSKKTYLSVTKSNGDFREWPYNQFYNRLEHLASDGVLYKYNKGVKSKILDASDKAIPNGVASLGADGKVPAEQLPVSIGGGGKSLGEVFFSPSKKATDNPGGLPLWTGEYYSNASSLYPDFYAWVKSHTELCKTKTEYDAAISTYGECPYYVVDEVAGSLRLPKLANYVKMANATDGITQAQAGLPNITGTGLYWEGTEDTKNQLTGCFFVDTNKKNNQGSGSTDSDNYSVAMDASRSSAIYGGSDTVTPAHTTLYPWVYAFNSAVEASVAQAAEFTGALIGKANTDLNNITQAGIETAIAWSMPDYSSAITGNAVAGEFIQCPADAAVCVFGSDPYTEDSYAYVSPDNGTTKYIVGRRKDDVNSHTQTTSFYFLVPKNWYFTTTVENGFTYQIYPLSGGQNA